jgi:hypothetical protein
METDGKTVSGTVVYSWNQTYVVLSAANRLTGQEIQENISSIVTMYETQCLMSFAGVTAELRVSDGKTWQNTSSCKCMAPLSRAVWRVTSVDSHDFFSVASGKCFCVLCILVVITTSSVSPLL